MRDPSALTCPCDDCDYRATDRASLVEHLVCEHLAPPQGAVALANHVAAYARAWAIIIRGIVHKSTMAPAPDTAAIYGTSAPGFMGPTGVWIGWSEGGEAVEA